MTSINIIGNLTKDPERKALSSGTNVTGFSVAVNQQNGEAAFYAVSTFAKTAENCMKYLKKGRKVAVRGELTVTEKNGKTYLNVRADGVEFLPSAKQENTAQEITANDFTDVTSADIPF